MHKKLPSVDAYLDAIATTDIDHNTVISMYETYSEFLFDWVAEIFSFVSSLYYTKQYLTETQNVSTLIDEALERILDTWDREVVLTLCDKLHELARNWQGMNMVQGVNTPRASTMQRDVCVTSIEKVKEITLYLFASFSRDQSTPLSPIEEATSLQTSSGYLSADNVAF